MTSLVGFIGVGNMGNPIALNILKKGFSLTVFDRNLRACDNLVQAGAKAASSIEQVLASSQVVMTCLP
ncbi:MAG: NAD(P)-binding domain-containing protein, partial [Nocardioidaceae bacterium]